MYNTKPRGSTLGSVIATIVSIGILVTAGWVFLNRQYVADVAAYWMYEPTTDVKTIEESIDLTRDGQFYFYASHPELADADSFNNNCPRAEASSPILGCYNNNRIFIYDIDNGELAGIEEVTAAHEMLHAVWNRLSEQEQQEIGGKLQAVYDQKADQALVERMEYYERNEPGELLNELHSILPTEMADIGDELETYYGRFFDDRQKVLDYHQNYSSVFTSLTNRANSLYEQLVALNKQIDTKSATYTAASQQLERDIISFNNRANANQFSSITQFNNERAVLIARSNQLDADRQAIGAMIDSYNDKYDHYEKVTSKIEVLNKSIDSITEPEKAPTLE